MCRVLRKCNSFRFRLFKIKVITFSLLNNNVILKCTQALKIIIYNFYSVKFKVEYDKIVKYQIWKLKITKK